MKKILLFFLTMLFMGNAIFDNKLFAQDPEFSQFYANPLYLNPAFAGSVRCPRICMNFRDEWPAIPGTFVTYSASYDQHVDALNGVIGVLFSQDQAGEATLTTTTASLIYSYQLNVSRTFSISAGFQASYMEKSLDESKLNFGDMIDPRRGFVLGTGEQITRNSISVPDFSAGLLGYSKNLFFGFSADHLTQPDESFVGVGSPLPMRLTAHAGAMIPLSNHYSQEDQITISPDVLFVKQQDFTQLNIGFYMMKGPIVGGVWYRNQDAIIALIGFQKKSIRMGYSYDITVSKLTEATAGAQEISLMFIFSCRPKIRHYRTISCPSF